MAYSNRYLTIKRILDWIFAFVLLIFAFPIMLLSAIAIKLESSGPALFRQKRPGKNGKIFAICKFRTMRIETNSSGRKLSDMERMTKVGKILRKTSIDELPQLFNILMGQMSFIGPRPLLVQYLAYYSKEQMRRHDVLPGISGWAQVNGRNTISWEAKFKMDVWYVDNVSAKVDAKILWMTIMNVVKKKDINSSEGDTMTGFTGTSNVKSKEISEASSF